MVLLPVNLETNGQVITKRNNMKHLLVLTLFALSACGGKLSQEEREKLREGMATQDIRRVTDAELQEAALALGSAILRDITKTDPYLINKKAIDSLAAARGVSIYSLSPDEPSMKEIENKLIEAYIAGASAGTAGDNLQSIGNDSLLFTHPVFRLHPDGSQEFTHAVGIRISKRSVILSMPQP